MHRGRPGNRLHLATDLRLLVLGGTVFLGRAIVESALQRGHRVTLFNRGQTNGALFEGQVEKLKGDREGGLESLRGRTWDAVIDPSGFVPRLVGDSARLLSDSGHYTFISSVSVYPINQTDKSESAPVEELAAAGSEDFNQHYGPLKALSEQAAREAMPGRVLVLRPGLIVGPHDNSERFTYWMLRIARGGEVLAPAEPDREVQFIDVRDLADFALRMAERKDAGTYNATGPHRPLRMGALLDEVIRVTASEARLTWVEEQFLLDQGAEPWMGLPLWLPPAMGSLHAPIERALAAGLDFRPLHETIADTLHWAMSRPHPPLPRPGRKLAGTSPEKEAEILAAWHARGG